MLKPRGLECEGRLAARVWSCRTPAATEASLGSHRQEPAVAWRSEGLPSPCLWTFCFHHHEEGSDLRAQDKSHPLAVRRPRVQGSGKGPQILHLTDPGMKGDGGAVWGLMWKYCISVRTLRYQGQGVEAALP